MIAIVKGFRAAEVLTMGGKGRIEDGLLLVENGTLEYVGSYNEAVVPEGAEIKDFGQMTIMPGLVDAHTHLGIHEEGEGWEGQDTNEMTDPVTPHVRGIDGLNPEDMGFQDAAVAGITTVSAGPGSGNVIGGQFATVKTAGPNILHKRVVREPSAMKMATGENPKRVYGEKDKTPSTRLGTAAKLRETLFATEDYLSRKRESEDEGNSFQQDFKLESLLPVLKGDLKAKIHAHRADDIVTAIRIAEEFGLNFSIDHCTEGHKIADFLAEHNAQAVVGPSMTSRSKREVIERTFRTPGVLAQKGVKVAITSDAPVVPIQYLPLLAAFAVREGMEKRQALRAITIDSAQVAGVGDRVGSLDVGKDADFIVTNGSILELGNQVEDVFVYGERIDRSDFPRPKTASTF